MDKIFDVDGSTLPWALQYETNTKMARRQTAWGPYVFISATVFVALFLKIEKELKLPRIKSFWRKYIHRLSNIFSTRFSVRRRNKIIVVSQLSMSNKRRFEKELLKTNVFAKFVRNFERGFCSKVGFILTDSQKCLSANLTRNSKCKMQRKEMCAPRAYAS